MTVVVKDLSSCHSARVLWKYCSFVWSPFSASTEKYTSLFVCSHFHL